jgi:C-terminal processing protease CtpA/Prc
MTTHSSIAHRIAEFVRDRYVFADVGERVHTFLTEQAKCGAYKDLSADEFASQITGELRLKSNDQHLRVRYWEEAHIPESPGDTVREQNDRAAHCQQMAYGIGASENHAGGVAILSIKDLVESSLSKAAFEKALRSVADADALVIDLRECVGGAPDTVTLVCSHLFDVRTQLSTIVPRAAPEEQFWADPSVYPIRFGGQKTVAIAVANFTFSGAEMLAYDLQSCGRATIVGAVTGGGAHACSFHWPNPHFSLLLPEARPVNPITRTNWEVCGIAPDIACSENDALRVAIDHVLRGG